MQLCPPAGGKMAFWLLLLVLAVQSLEVNGVILPSAFSDRAPFATPLPAARTLDLPPLSLLRKTLEGAESILNFFSRDYSDTNMDALFGLRIGQGQLQASLALCESSRRCDVTLTSRLARLERGAEETVEKAMPYVKAKAPIYYHHFKGWIDKPFKFPYIRASLGDVSSITSLGPLGAMLGALSDECLARVMGNFKDPLLNKDVDRCNITNICWSYMTDPRASSYRITHDLIYFLDLETNHCQQDVAAYVGYPFDFRRKREDLCRRIYVEANVMTKGGISYWNRDLLMEQMTMCGLLGYEEFLQKDWLEVILSWLTPDGCFKLPPEARGRVPIFQQPPPIDSRGWRNLMHGPRRRLLTEQVMEDGCLAHMTTLGFSTLCTFLHYFATQEAGFV